MTILALDLSTKASGWAIFEDGNLKDYGCITAGSANLYKRIDKMVEGIKEILEKYKVNKVVLEDVIPDDVKHNVQVYKALTYLQGYILHTLDDYKLLPAEFFTASQWRKRCGIHTGRGVKRESLKPKDIQFVKDTYNIKVNDDIADAICIGHAYISPPAAAQYETSGFEFK